MKYTICKEGLFLADEDNKRKLFDSKEEAARFKDEHNIDASIHGYMDASKMKSINGWTAWDLFKKGDKVYTKIFGLDWTLCEEGRFDFDDFTCGHFSFYVECGA